MPDGAGMADARCHAVFHTHRTGHSPGGPEGPPWASGDSGGSGPVHQGGRRTTGGGVGNAGAVWGGGCVSISAPFPQLSCESKFFFFK